MSITGSERFIIKLVDCYLRVKKGERGCFIKEIRHYRFRKDIGTNGVNKWIHIQGSHKA